MFVMQHYFSIEIVCFWLARWNNDRRHAREKRVLIKKVFFSLSRASSTASRRRWRSGKRQDTPDENQSAVKERLDPYGFSH